MGLRKKENSETEKEDKEETKIKIIMIITKN